MQRREKKKRKIKLLDDAWASLAGMFDNVNTLKSHSL